MIINPRVEAEKSIIAPDRGFPMSSSFSAKTVCRLVAASAVAAVVGFSTQAGAVEFIGSTNGCFGNGCIPVFSAGASTIQLAGSGLSYTNSTFDVTTAGSFVAIGNAPGAPNVNNLGSFTLNNTTFDYTNNHFNLLVTFSAPSGTTPTSVVIEDLIIGTVSAQGGGILIDFDNTAHLFTYDGGTFLFSVNDVSLTAGGEAGNSIAFSGQILVTAVPEPSTWAMMILGFMGVGFMAYRRRSAMSGLRLV
jgi:hypothetical protein